MARPPRPMAGGICYHVLNRGNDRRRVFYKSGDYQAFEQLLAEAHQRLPMRILAWCLMPNHCRRAGYVPNRPRQGKITAASRTSVTPESRLTPFLFRK